MENLDPTIAGVSIFVHAWIIDEAPYRLLLGKPFQIAVQCDMEDIGEMLIIFDPKKPGCCLQVPMMPHHAHLVLTEQTLCRDSPLGPDAGGQLHISSLLSAYLPMASQYLCAVYDFMMSELVL